VSAVSDSDFDDLNANLAGFGSDTDNTDDTDDTDADDPDVDGSDDFDLSDLDPEQRTQIEEAQRAMEEARARLSEVPAEVVVTNHVMGLYELAAIHLSADEPDLVQAALAIDAVACLVDGLGDRLGPDAPTMLEALNNIRLAFVQIKG
jgi:hypothetical protein